jgi:hypothetical protein
MNNTGTNKKLSMFKKLNLVYGKSLQASGLRIQQHLKNEQLIAPS